MNKHLKPVFYEILPALEKSNINYWVYGGVSVAAYAGKFIRCNGDVDVFVLENNFQAARKIMVNFCKEDSSYEEKACQLKNGWRQKSEIRKKGQEVLSIVSVREVDKKVQHIVGGLRTYNLDLLNRIPRKIEDFRFWTPPDELIRLIFNDYIRYRSGPPKSTTKIKVKSDARIMLPGQDINVINPIWK